MIEITREEFEKMIAKHIVPAINKAQDEAEEKYGIRFEVEIDWHITKGQFKDLPTEGYGA
jgi:hypothetical protein